MGMLAKRSKKAKTKKLTEENSKRAQKEAEDKADFSRGLRAAGNDFDELWECIEDAVEAGRDSCHVWSSTICPDYDSYDSGYAHGLRKLIVGKDPDCKVDIEYVTERPVGSDPLCPNAYTTIVVFASW